MATLSNILDKQCESHAFPSMHLDGIATDSSVVVNTLHVSEYLRQSVVHYKRAFPELCKPQRRSLDNPYPCGIFSTTVRQLLCIIQPPFLALNVSPLRGVPGSTDTLPGYVTDRFVDTQPSDSAQQPESRPIQPLLPSSGEILSHEYITSDISGSESPHRKAYVNQIPADNLSLNKNLSRKSFFGLSPGSGSLFSTDTAASSTPTVVKTNHTSQPYARILGMGGSTEEPEQPLVILRVQVISCNNLEAKGFSGYSDPCVRLLIILFASLC